MQRSCVFRSVGELDQLRDLARGASVEVVQLKPGIMHGVIAHADFGDSSLHLNRLSLPARGWGAVASDRWTFVAFPRTVEGRFNSFDLNSDRMLVYPPGGEFEGTITRPFQDWVFTVTLDSMLRACEPFPLRISSKLPGGLKCLRPDPAILRRLRDFAQQAMAVIGESPKLLHDHRVRRALDLRLVDMVTQTLLSSGEEPKRRRKIRSHWQLVRQAEDHLRSNLDGLVSITKLCAATGVSERTLRNAFDHVIGVPPNAYLRAVRLSRVRTELEQSSPSQSAITAVAMRWGFVHLSRFSQDYKRFFGELPSETLRRSRTRNKRLAQL